MNLNIRSGTVRYNHKILVSDGKFSLGKNEKVNASELDSHKVANTTHAQTTATHGQKSTTHAQTTTTHTVVEQKPTNTHEEEKIVLILFLAGTFTIYVSMINY